MGFFGGLLGAGLGFLEGGPVGAVAGAVSGSGVLSGLMGGGSQSSGGGKTGISALPPEAQAAYKGMTENASNLLLGPNAASMYTPLPQTAAETSAYGLEQPMTPSALSQLANTYMNPYSDFITKQIDQQFDADHSAYEQNLAGSGFAPGTTTNDFADNAAIDQAKGMAVGSALSGQWNNAVNSGLAQNQTSFGDLLQEGSNQRNLYAGTQQAPISALNALGNVLGFYPNSGQNSNQMTSTNNQLPNFTTLLGMGNALMSSPWSQNGGLGPTGSFSSGGINWGPLYGG